MSPKALRHFCMVATELNFRRAAEHLHIAQPALSVSIARLEEQLGVELFVRGRRGVELTEAGRLLLPEAVQILRRIEGLQLLVRQAGAGEAGTLRLAFVGTAAYRLVPQALNQLQRSYPDIEVELYESITERIVEGLRNRSLDLGVVRYPLEQYPGLELEIVDEDGYCVALPIGHPLAVRKSLSLAALANEPLLVPPKEHSPALRNLMLQGFQARGIMPRVSWHQATQMATVLAMVEIGSGIALVPQCIVGRVAHRVVFRQLEKNSRFRTGLALLFDPGHLSPLAEHFRQAARAAKDNVKAGQL